MGNIFKSREVYKHTVINNQHVIIPVKGVYVANQARPVYNIDHVLSITDIGGAPATINNYVDTSINLSTPATICSLSVTAPTMDITYYSITEQTLSSQPTYCSLSATTPLMDIDYFTNTTLDLSDRPTYCSLSTTTTLPTIINVFTEQHSEKDFTLQITNVSGNTVTIT